MVMDQQNTERDISQLGNIVSRTDLNGTLIAVNEAFVEASRTGDRLIRKLSGVRFKKCYKCQY